MSVFVSLLFVGITKLELCNERSWSFVTRENFKTLYPQYNDYIQHLAIASFYISNDIKKEALEQNVMVLQRKGELIETFLP